VRTLDAAGNLGPPATQTWSVNLSLPALSLSAPTDASLTNDPTPAISGTGGRASGDASTVSVKLFSGTSIAGSPLQTISTTVSSSTGAWITPPSPALPDGTYTVYAQQIGTAGTAYTSATSFTVDTTPPATTITSGPQGTTSAITARFTFASSKPRSTFECQFDGGSWSSCSSPQSYSSLALGIHVFSVRAIDAAGNVDPTPAADSWTIDTTANVPVTLTSPADRTVTADTTPTFAGAASPSDGALTVEIDDADGNAVEVLSPAVAATWSTTAAPALPDGTYTAFASQVSGDGSTTWYSPTIQFTVDTTPPTPTLTSGPAGKINDPTPTFGGGAGTAAGDGAVALKVYSGASASGTPVDTVAAVVSGGSWSATASALPDGTYTVRAEQSDAAGNLGVSATRTFTLDVPPQTAITSKPPSSTTATSASFSFTSSKSGSTFACRLDAGTWSSCSSPQTYNGLSDGQHSFSVRATDAAGTVDPAPPADLWTVKAVGSPPPSGNPGTTAGPPRVTPKPALRLTLTARASQRLDRRGRLAVSARASKPATLVLAGRIVVVLKTKRGAKASRRVLLAARMALVKLRTTRRITLTLKVPARVQKAIVSALRAKLRVTLTLSGVLSKPGMKAATGRVTIRLLR
jgi:hypothetical protein